MPLSTEVGLGPGDFVLDGNSASLAKKGDTAPNFRRISCGQTARWIKMPPGTEVGLGPDDIVLDGNPAPPKGHSLLPNFRPMSIVAKQLDSSGYHLVRRQASTQPTLS